MAWNGGGYYRNINILQVANINLGNGFLDLYQPGTLNTSKILENKSYSGFITSLRCVADITSIAEVEFPVRTIDQTDQEYSDSLKGLATVSPRKLLDLYFRTSDAGPFLIGQVFLFNRRPYYSIDLLRYLTDGTSFEMASDGVLSIKISSDGFGVLSGADKLTFIGSSVEEVENNAPSQTINIFNSGGGSGGGDTSNLITNQAGDLIVTTQGEFISI